MCRSPVEPSARNHSVSLEPRRDRSSEWAIHRSERQLSHRVAEMGKKAARMKTVPAHGRLTSSCPAGGGATRARTWLAVHGRRARVTIVVCGLPPGPARTPLPWPGCAPVLVPAGTTTVPPGPRAHRSRRPKGNSWHCNGRRGTEFSPHGLVQGNACREAASCAYQQKERAIRAQLRPQGERDRLPVPRQPDGALSSSCTLDDAGADAATYAAREHETKRFADFSAAQPSGVEHRRTDTS